MGWPHPQAETFSVPCSRECFLVLQSSHFGMPNRGADVPRSPEYFLASRFGIGKNIPLLFTCKIRTRRCFLLHQWIEWRKELLCECINQKHDLSCQLALCPCCKGLSSASPQGSKQLASVRLFPISQTCHLAAASTQRQIAIFYPASLAKNVLCWSCVSPAILHAEELHWEGTGSDSTLLF